MSDTTPPSGNSDQPESEPERLRHELAQARAEIDELKKRKSSLLAMAVHDLRTPLSIIQGFAQLLAAELEPDAGPAVDEYIANILAHSSSLENMIENLVALDHFERGDKSLTIECGDLNLLAEETIAQLEGLAGIKALTIAFHPAPTAAPADIDLGWMRRALYNLLSHVIKYARPGGRVAVDVARDGEFYRLRFHDPDRQLSPNMLTRLFDLVDVRQGENSAMKGMDMGLVIARYIAEQHYGQVGATAKKGHGMTLDLFIPPSHCK